MKKNLLKIIFVGLLATIFTSCGSSGSSTATNVEDNSTVEQAEADRLAAEATRLQAIEDARIAEEERLAKIEADRIKEEERLAKIKADANTTEEPVVVTTGNWEILPF